MQFSEFIQWAFLGLISGGVVILYQMKTSMNELNTKLAVFVTKLENQQERINGIDSRLNNLEHITRFCETHKKY